MTVDNLSVNIPPFRRTFLEHASGRPHRLAIRPFPFRSFVAMPHTRNLVLVNRSTAEILKLLTLDPEYAPHANP